MLNKSVFWSVHDTSTMPLHNLYRALPMHKTVQCTPHCETCGAKMVICIVLNKSKRDKYRIPTVTTYMVKTKQDTWSCQRNTKQDFLLPFPLAHRQGEDRYMLKIFVSVGPAKMPFPQMTGQHHKTKYHESWLC